MCRFTSLWRAALAGIYLVCAPAALPNASSDTSAIRKDSLLRTAQELSANGRFLEAVTAFLSAGADTGTAKERFGLGMAYASLNDFKHGSRYLNEATAIDSTNVVFRYQLARFLVQSGAAKQGREQYERILDLDSSYIPALTALGKLDNEPDTYEEAADLFKRVLRLNPDDYLSHYYLGNLMVGLLNPDTAVICLNSCLQLNPHFVPALNLLASIHYGKKRYNEALTCYRQVSALRPSNPEYFNKVGLCHRALEQFELAVQAFRRATELDSLSASYFGNLGHSYYRLSKFDSSVHAYRRATVLEDENGIFYTNLALALQRIDSIEAAVRAYRRAIWTYHPEAVLDLQIKIGSMYFLDRQYRKAIENYETALRSDPGNLDAEFYVASAFDNLNEYTVARQHYNRYLKLAESLSSESQRVSWSRTRLKALEYLESVRKK